MFIILSFSSEYEKSKFEHIYNHYKKLLLYKAYQILRDHSLAEDAVSETFIRIYKNLHKIEDVDSNRTIAFLVTIVKNTSLTLLSKSKNRSTVSMDAFDGDFEQEDDFNLEDAFISEGATESLLKLVDQLKEDLKTPFLLKYAHDLSHKEIGKILSISENNVTVRIHRAKKKLVTLLREEGYAYEAQ